MEFKIVNNSPRNNKDNGVKPNPERRKDYEKIYNKRENEMTQYINLNNGKALKVEVINVEKVPLNYVAPKRELFKDGYLEVGVREIFTDNPIIKSEIKL